MSALSALFCYLHHFTKTSLLRFITLFSDLIWQLLTGGIIYVGRSVWRQFQKFLPIKLTIDEHIRKLHTFIVGKTGVGKSVLLHHLIRHYQTRNHRPTDIYCDWVRDKFSWLGTDTVEDCQEAFRELIRLKIFEQPKWKRKWRPHTPEFQIK